MSAAAPARTIAPDRRGRILFGVVLAAGIVLRLLQVLRNPPLWLDELALANGILSGSFTGLFDGPADFAQAGPPGFLVLEWLVNRVFPASDLALRVPSLLFGSAAIIATWMAAREISGERDAWVAPGLVAIASTLIYMSGQVKPYAADAFFAPLIFACALRHERVGTPGSWRALLAAGAIGPLFAFGAVFANAGAVAYLLVRRAAQRSWFSSGAMFTAWGASALVSAGLGHGLLGPEAMAMMDVYWAPHYPPFPPSSLSDVTWFGTRMLDLMWLVLGLRAVHLFGVVVLVGVALAWRQRPGASLLLTTPLVAAMAAAIIRQFPFGERLLHWTAPIFALLLGVAASVVAGWLRSRQAPMFRGGDFVPGAFVLLTPLLILVRSPVQYVPDNIEPVIEHIAASAQAGDVAYVAWGAWHSWHRYGQDIKASLGEVVTGGCPSEYPRGYLRDLDTLRGRPRVWLVFGRFEGNEWAVHQLRIRYLDSIGSRAESLSVTEPGVSQSGRVDLFRYDLSDPARLGRAYAATFPVPPELVRKETGCYRIDAMYRKADGTRVVPFN